MSLLKAHGRPASSVATQVVLWAALIKLGLVVGAALAVTSQYVVNG